MKHILRKLHIGGSHDSFEGRNHDVGPRVLDGRTQLVRADTVAQAETTSPSTLTPDHRVSSGFSGWFTRHSLLSSTASSPSNGRSRLDTTENAAERTSEARAPASFNFYEEEYQVQLALALSVSNQNVEEDPEALQIRAAKRISLGRPPSPGNTPAEITAHRFWNYNVLDYEEKILDGFYDVYGGVSDFGTAGKLPPLVDLQSTPVTDTLGCEVVLVNRAIDPDLVQMEQAALCIAVDCGVGGLSLQHSGVVQKIADLVVHHMGGPVVDANDMLKRWRKKSHELRASLNTIVLPLGCLQFGLSRHRALLFKVLADHVGIPCRLVKGSHYTGTDEGAVNIVKLDNEREYIVDLMGAPGTLLPGEIVGATGNLDVIESHSLLEEIFSQIDSNFHAMNSSRAQKSAPAGGDSVTSVKGGKEVSTSGSSHLTEDALLGLSSSAKHTPEHVLDSKEESHSLPVESTCGNLEIGCLQDPRVDAPAAQGSNLSEKESQIEVFIKKSEDGTTDFLMEVNSGAVGDSSYELGSHRQNVLEKMMLGHHQHYMDCWTKHVNDKRDPVLENVAEWEIPWEDIVIGERIGLGSYGEVHHGDWHGKEVAVKRFLDQDFSGDALNEFISEVQIMRRMQHPNVVLFLGAVTRPPNLSIVTEYLPRGSLFRLLHRPNWQLDERQRLKMALDVAEGMNYLHTSMPIIVHRDLKSPNLLVDKNWVVKVCDFGLSRMKHHTFLSSKSTAGTPEWMAPEVLRNEPSNEKCDVYSFGVILWELVTLQPPWNGMNPMQVVGAVGFQNRRLEIPKNVDPAVARIMRDCWQSDPSMRPPFSELTIALKPLQRLLRD